MINKDCGIIRGRHAQDTVCCSCSFSNFGYCNLGPRARMDGRNLNFGCCCYHSYCHFWKQLYQITTVQKIEWSSRKKVCQRHPKWISPAYVGLWRTCRWYSTHWNRVNYFRWWRSSLESWNCCWWIRDDWRARWHQENSSWFQPQIIQKSKLIPHLRIQSVGRNRSHADLSHWKKLSIWKTEISASSLVVINSTSTKTNNFGRTNWTCWNVLGGSNLPLHAGSHSSWSLCKWSLCWNIVKTTNIKLISRCFHHCSQHYRSRCSIRLAISCYHCSCL